MQLDPRAVCCHASSHGGGISSAITHLGPAALEGQRGPGGRLFGHVRGEGGGRAVGRHEHDLRAAVRQQYGSGTSAVRQRYGSSTAAVRQQYGSGTGKRLQAAVTGSYGQAVTAVTVIDTNTPPPWVPRVPPTCMSPRVPVPPTHSCACMPPTCMRDSPACVTHLHAPPLQRAREALGQTGREVTAGRAAGSGGRRSARRGALQSGGRKSVFFSREGGACRLVGGAVTQGVSALSGWAAHGGGQGGGQRAGAEPREEAREKHHERAPQAAREKQHERSSTREAAREKHHERAPRACRLTHLQSAAK